MAIKKVETKAGKKPGKKVEKKVEAKAEKKVERKEYEPYGKSWHDEMMKFSKDSIIDGYAMNGRRCYVLGELLKQCLQSSVPPMFDAARKARIQKALDWTGSLDDEGKELWDEL